MRRDIAHSFAAAAATYDGAADLQDRVAGELDRRIGGLDLPAAPHILEIGCGTGLLSARLARRFPQAHFVFADLAPEMLRRCRTRLGTAPNAHFLAMDGALPCFAPAIRFDLICSSLSLQWMADPAAGLTVLATALAPGGQLAFATLGQESFREWRSRSAGAADSLRRYPDLAGWRRTLPAKLLSRLEAEAIVESYPDGLAFLRRLRDIGATVPDPAQPPAGTGELRRKLRGFATGLDVTWQIVYGLCQMSAGPT